MSIDYIMALMTAINTVVNILRELRERKRDKSKRE